MNTEEVIKLANDYHNEIIKHNPQAEAYGFDSAYIEGYKKCEQDMINKIRDFIANYNPYHLPELETITYIDGGVDMESFANEVVEYLKNN